MPTKFMDYKQFLKANQSGCEIRRSLSLMETETGNQSFVQGIAVND